MNTESNADGARNAKNWDCVVCTFSNSPHEIRCSLCHMRKGTSTRKPRANTDMMAKQVVQQQEQINRIATKKKTNKTPAHRSKINGSKQRGVDESSCSSFTSSSTIECAQPTESNPASPSVEANADSGPSFRSAFDSSIDQPSSSSSTSSLIKNGSYNEVDESHDNEDTVLEEPIPQPLPAIITKKKRKPQSQKVTLKDGRKVCILSPKVKLKNLDRTNVQRSEVTVNNMTVLITEFKPKRKVLENSDSHQPKKKKTSKKLDTSAESPEGNKAKTKAGRKSKAASSDDSKPTKAIGRGGNRSSGKSKEDGKTPAKSGTKEDSKKKNAAIAANK